MHDRIVPAHAPASAWPPTRTNVGGRLDPGIHKSLTTDTEAEPKKEETNEHRSSSSVLAGTCVWYVGRRSGVCPIDVCPIGLRIDGGRGGRRQEHRSASRRPDGGRCE